eukprot:tig00020601_g11716.t1
MFGLRLVRAAGARAGARRMSAAAPAKSPTVKLNTGAEIPVLGLGTWASPPKTVGPVVEAALEKEGYRHLDLAHVYENEAEVGQALKSVFSRGSLKRDEVFITSKLWNTYHERDMVRKGIERTLKDLQVDCLDLYLVHWPVAFKAGPKLMPPHPSGKGVETVEVPLLETWQAMEELVQAGLTKAIGVSNFSAEQLVELEKGGWKIVPAVNQVEAHPYLPQDDLVEFCKSKGIHVTAYSPLGANPAIRQPGQPVLMKDELVLEVAKRVGKSPAQVLLRWALQRQAGHMSAIPKTANPARLAENISVFDFELDGLSMDLLNEIGYHAPVRYASLEWWRHMTVR